MKEIIKFIHLSDIHMLKSYKGTIMETVIEGGLADPAQLLQEALKHVSEKHPDIDFIIITGDMVHEGSREDYALLREVIEAGSSPVPVFLTLGNHDNTPAFREGYLKEKPENCEYYYTAEIKGLRIIALDSGGDSIGRGEISDEQLHWLKELLKEKSPAGSILLLHHPAVTELLEDYLCYCLKNAHELSSVIQGGDILAIFSGHKHRNSVTSLGGIPQFTADSLGYGALFDEHDMYITDRHGYSYCVIQEGQVYVRFESFPDKSAVVAKVSMKELMEYTIKDAGN